MAESVSSAAAPTETWCAPASQTLEFNVGTQKVTSFNDSHFFKVRLAYGVSNNLLEEFDFDDMRMPESKGGTVIGFTKDGRFMVKEINQEDHESLLECCKLICQRVLSCESFITPTLAHFVRTDGRNYFATLNCLPANKTHGFTFSRYDLKGNRDDKTEVRDGDTVATIHNRCFNFAKCWFGCDAKCFKCLHKEDRTKYVRGKQHAFECAFHVTPKQRTMILDSLNKDVDVFDKCGTMDYSLLVTIIKTTKDEILELGGELPKSYLPHQPIVCVDPDDGRILAYYIGVIDYLQQWTMGKKIAHLVKCCCAPHPISTVPPLAYRHQFYDHFDVKFCAMASKYLGMTGADRGEVEAGGIVSSCGVPKSSETSEHSRCANADSAAAPATAANESSSNEEQTKLL